MIDVLNIILLISLILIIWFKTNAWLEYTELFNLNFISKYKEYNKLLIREPLLEYHIFLLRYYNNFIIRLITCPICFSTWIGILFGCFTKIILFPTYAIGGLFIYLIISKLLK